MTAFAKDIAAVQQLLPVRIDERRWRQSIVIRDRNDNFFCLVPCNNGNDHSRAVVLVAAINALKDQLVQRPHHG